MMQGDSYALGIEILDSNQKVVTSSDVRDVEIVVGSLRKSYANKSVTYDMATGKWLFPLSQKETFQMLPANARVQLRVVWKSGDVEGVDLGHICVRESISKEVL